MEGRFKIICDVCGTHWDAKPDSSWLPDLKLQPNMVTCAITDICPVCLYMKDRPISHRIKFLCNVVTELEQLKEELYLCRKKLAKKK